MIEKITFAYHSIGWMMRMPDVELVVGGFVEVEVEDEQGEIWK